MEADDEKFAKAALRGDCERRMAEGMQLRLALYQPDIPQNTGTMMRMAACFGVPVDIIEPAGFPVSDRHFRRAGMDYLGQCEIARHISWRAFDETRRAAGRRLVLLTTRSDVAHADFRFAAGDTLMVGRESAGVPEAVHDAVDARIVIPMRAELRSLNVAVSAAVALGEALRQTGGFRQPG
jgi:tRNA (cytidine/uridine-2'-O-)-methyltransferase